MTAAVLELEPVVEQEPRTEIRCRTCHTVLAVTSGPALIFPACLIRRPIWLHCLSCGRQRLWRPAPCVIE